MNQTAEVLEVLCECRSGLRKEICCGAEKVRRLTDEDMQSCAATLQQAEETSRNFKGSEYLKIN